jgi:two-component sensor histidine kinase
MKKCQIELAECKKKLSATKAKLKAARAKILEIERLNDTMRHETLRQMDVIFAAVDQIRYAEDKQKEINKSLALINAFDELQMLLDIDEQRLISIQHLATNIFKQHNKADALNPEFIINGDIDLMHHTANPLARVINELIANSFEHAFRQSAEHCKICLHITQSNGHLELLYHDTGKGLKKSTPKMISHKGLYLIYSLCAQNLGGTIKKVQQDEYIAYQIRIPHG